MRHLDVAGGTGDVAFRVLAAIRAAGGDVVCAACIVDRSGGRADVGAPLPHVARLERQAHVRRHVQHALSTVAHVAQQDAAALRVEV